jgi:hypothetical protein
MSGSNETIIESDDYLDGLSISDVVVDHEPEERPIKKAWVKYRPPVTSNPDSPVMC